MGIRKIGKSIWRGMLIPLKWVKNLAENIWNKIPKTVRIPIFVFIFALPTWVILAFLIRRFLSNFGEGLLVETFGMLLDILVIGILILWLNEIRDKKLKRELEIKRYQEEIDDFSGWQAEEAKYRIMGNIKRLVRNGITSITLTNCYLEEANLQGFQLQESLFMGASLRRASLVGTNLQKASLALANFQEANFYEAKLQGAYLTASNFRKANFMNAKLQGAYLTDSNLQESNLAFSNLQGVWLEKANLRGAIVRIEQLSKAKTLYGARLDPELEKEIKEKYPHLLEKPEEQELADNGEEDS